MLNRTRAARGSHRCGPVRVSELDSAVLSRSRYSTTLRCLLARLEESRLWIGDFDQLSSEPAAVLRSICTFLTIEFDGGLFAHMYEKAHEGMRSDIDRQMYEYLRAALESEYDALAEMLPELALRWRVRHYG
jgi:hypothetical protein